VRRRGIQKTYRAKPSNISKNWWIVDASGKTLGRLATRIATVLMGKHKPEYTPYIDSGDFVVVTNAAKIHVTGNKLEQKEYQRYTGYLGGRKLESLKSLLARKPEKVIQPHAPDPQATPQTPEFEQAEPGRVLAAPATRRRARELGVDLGAIQGTGPSGRITNEDLARFTAGGGTQVAASKAAPATAPKPYAPVAIAAAPQGATEERIPFRGLRRKIAEAMSRSKHTAAHFTYVDDIDVTRLVTIRKQAKEVFAPQGINVTYLPFIMKAVVEAHRQFPGMNASLDETTQELVIKKYYNFGIATDTDQGLIVPVVKDVDRKSIAQIAWEIQEVARMTREGQVGVDRLQGGTFTITNAGNIGGLFATPVINFPEVAILGVHAIKKAAIVDENDQIKVGSKMYLSVSIDHRIVDGATGARWMNVVKSCLEEPERLLFGTL